MSVCNIVCIYSRQNWSKFYLFLQLEDVDNVELYRDYMSALCSHGLQQKLTFSATAQKLMTSCTKLLYNNKELVSI